jgi:hypothetical protein
MPEVRWPRIKEILDNVMKRWAEEHGRDPKLKVSHQADLGWDTKEQLADSKPYDLQLIEPDKVGNGRAEETYLVRILRNHIGGYRRMPSRGPYVPEEEIQEIIDWIEAGMPD